MTRPPAGAPAAPSTARANGPPADPRDWRLDRAALARRLGGTPLAPALPALSRLLEARGEARGRASRHGDLPRWTAALGRLPAVGAHPSVRVDGPVVVADAGRGPGAGAVAEALAELHPWRKGPFRIDGVDVDTEWRSDLKWDRLLPHVAPLAGRCVLDVGCGSGYHLWRMREAGASATLGVEPTLLYLHQFEAVARCAPDAPVACLPLTLEALAAGALAGAFDTVFSMGVLYHRPDPREHLAALAALLRPGGELVLETLVPDRALDARLEDLELGPATGDGRYARMRNVHPLPSLARLERLCAAAGFADARPVSLAVTTDAEQRATDWMRFDSLERALAPPTDAVPADHPDRLTVEGLPRPARALLVARRPG